MKTITSRDNDLVRHLTRIANSSRARREARQVLLDGEHLVSAWRDTRSLQGVVLVLRASRLADARMAPWVDVEGVAETVALADPLFDRIAPVDSPTGLMALAPWPEERFPETAGPGFVAMLDRVQDPGNLGAILRSAAAAGATGALLSPGCADAWAPRSLRGGMGAQLCLPLRDNAALAQAALDLDYPLVVADGRSATSLFEMSLPRRCAIVIGSEGQGVSPVLLGAAHTKVHIPMEMGIESLNAAAAATLVFFEWARQHGGLALSARS